MKQVLSFIIVSGLIFASCKQADKTPADVAAIMKDSSKYTSIQWADTAINFGSKKMGDVVNITFLCTNTGNKSLYLYDVHPSCGCTLVDYSKAPIEPGSQGKIEAQFDTKKSHPGEVHKTVFVRSNSSNGSRYLTFTGTVLPSDSSATAK
jgi:hypothetical protein